MRACISTTAIVILVTTLAWFPLCETAFAQQIGDEVVVTTSEARLMAGQDDLGEVPWLTFLKVEDVSGEWYWVEYEGQKGWVNDTHIASLSTALYIFDLEESEFARHVALGQVHERLGDFGSALEHWTAVHNLEPDSPIWLEARGNCYAQLGQHQVAIDDFTAALRSDPNRASAYSYMYSSWKALGDTVRAVACLNSALELEPSNAWLLSGRSEMFYLLGDPHSALQDADLGLAIDSSIPALHELRAASHLALGNLDEALAGYNRFLELDPVNAFVIERRASIYLARGEFQIAISELTRAIELWEASSEYTATTNARLERGEAYVALGDIELALQDADAAVALSAHPVALRQRAEWHSLLGHFSEAAQDFEAAFSSDPFDEQLLNGYAWFLATCPAGEFRDGAKAVELGELVCELTGWSNPMYIDTVAAAYAETGDFERAAKWQDHVVSIIGEEHREGCLARLALYRQLAPYRENDSQADSSLDEVAPAAPFAVP